MVFNQICLRLFALACWSMLTIHAVKAQNFPLTSHFMWNPQGEQAALVGSEGGIRLVGGYRYQWAGIEGAPQTAYAGADMKLPIKNSSGGIWVAYDKTGLTSFTQARLSYAYTLNVGSGEISAGVHAGIVSAGLNGAGITTPGGGGGNDDDLLPVDRFNGFRPELGAGIHYRHPVFHAGAFIQNAGAFTTEISGVGGGFRADYGRYVGILGGANIPLAEKWTLDPAFMVRTDFNNWQTDFALTATFNKRFSLGAGARGYNNNSLESLIGLARIGITSDLALAYSFDASLSDLNTVTRGSHEISIRYLIQKEPVVKKGKVMNHPRFL